jgi:hypothetical protein
MIPDERKKDVELLVCTVAACNANVVKVMYVPHILFTVDNMALRKYFLCSCLSWCSGRKRIIFHVVEERKGLFLVM